MIEFLSNQKRKKAESKKSISEGFIYRLNKDNEDPTVAVNLDVPKEVAKIEKDDKQSFEDFKTMYKTAIDLKCQQDYDTLEDSKLWEDCAKELYLQSKNYIMTGDEYKPKEELDKEVKIESYSVHWEYTDKKDNTQFKSKSGFTSIEAAQKFVDELKKKPIAKQGPTKEPEIKAESKSLEEAEDTDKKYNTMAFAQLLPMSYTDYVDNHIYDFVEEDEDDSTPDDVADYFIDNFKEDLSDEDAEDFEEDLAREYIKYKLDMMDKKTESTDIDDINPEQYAYENGFIKQNRSNSYKVMVEALPKVKTLIEKCGLKYYIHSDAETGPEADDPNFYDVYGELNDLINFYKEYENIINERDKILYESRTHRRLHKGDKFKNANGIVLTITDVDTEHLLDGEPQVTYQFSDNKTVNCHKESSVNSILNDNHYEKLDEAKLGNNTFTDYDEADYYRWKELYDNSGLARHKEAMEKAKEACKAKGIDIDETKGVYESKLTEKFFNLYKDFDSLYGISKYSPKELKDFILDLQRLHRISDKDVNIMLDFADKYQQLIDSTGYESKLQEEMIPNSYTTKCPKCGSANFLEIDGAEYEDGTQEYSLKCQDCGYIENDEFKKESKLQEDQYENERRKGKPSIRNIATDEYFDNQDWYLKHINNYKDENDFIEKNKAEIAAEYNLKEDKAIEVCKQIFNWAVSDIKDNRMPNPSNKINVNEVKLKENKYDNEPSEERYKKLVADCFDWIENHISKDDYNSMLDYIGINYLEYDRSIVSPTKYEEVLNKALSWIMDHTSEEEHTINDQIGLTPKEKEFFGITFDSELKESKIFQETDKDKYLKPIQQEVIKFFSNPQNVGEVFSYEPPVKGEFYNNGEVIEYEVDVSANKFYDYVGICDELKSSLANKFKTDPNIEKVFVNPEHRNKDTYIVISLIKSDIIESKALTENVNDINIIDTKWAKKLLNGNANTVIGIYTDKSSTPGQEVTKKNLIDAYIDNIEYYPEDYTDESIYVNGNLSKNKVINAIKMNDAYRRDFIEYVAKSIYDYHTIELI